MANMYLNLELLYFWFIYSSFSFLHDHCGITARPIDMKLGMSTLGFVWDGYYIVKFRIAVILVYVSIFFLFVHDHCNLDNCWASLDEN